MVESRSGVRRVPMGEGLPIKAQHELLCGDGATEQLCILIVAGFQLICTCDKIS